MIVRKEYYETEKKKHKVANIAEGPFEIVSETRDTAVIQDGDRQ